MTADAAPMSAEELERWASICTAMPDVVLVSSNERETIAVARLLATIDAARAEGRNGNTPMNLKALASRLRQIQDLDPPMSIITMNQLIEEIEHADRAWSALKLPTKKA